MSYDVQQDKSRTPEFAAPICGTIGEGRVKLLLRQIPQISSCRLSYSVFGSSQCCHRWAITGLTSGAITGVVARLEQAGYLRREPDPHDGRKQILHLALERAHIQDVIDPLQKDVAALLENFDSHQLTAIAGFLTRTTDLIYRYAALLRAETISSLSPARGTGRAPSANNAKKKPEMKVQQ